MKATIARVIRIPFPKVKIISEKNDATLGTTTERMKF
jgi:hypothetical protein